jgi:hypothetical protein
LWDGSSGNQGYWDEPNGYRTLIHLFGHYALYLYDEYFVSLIDVDGHIIGQAPAACTGVEVLTNDDDATNASIMYYQYNASELADDDRWTVNCQNTEQARVNGQSDWQTVLAHFGGPEWEINTPTNRGSVMAGPDEFPRHLLSFPSTQRHNTGTDSPLRHLTVLAPDDQPFPNAVVTLYTPPYSDTTIIDQGLVDGQGQIAIYGASAGDIVQALSFDRTLRAAATIDGRLTYTLTLRPTGLDERHAQPGSYLTLVPSSEEGSLFLLVQGLPDENCFLSAEIFPSDVEDPPQRIQLDCQTTGRVCTGHVSGISLGGGEIRITGVAGGQPVVSDTEYDLMLIDDAVENNLVSGDANLRIQIDAGSLPIDTAYAVLAASNRAPGPFPIGKQVSGKAYQIRFSGAITGFERPALLTIGPHPAWGGESGDLALYHWDTVAKEWEWVIDEWGEPDNSVTAPVERLGTYALMGDEPFRVFLPVVLRQ